MRQRPIGSHRLPKTKPTVHTFFAVRFATLLRSLGMLTKWVTSVHERFAGLGQRPLKISGERGFDDAAADVGQAEIASLKAVGQLQVVESE